LRRARLRRRRRFAGLRFLRHASISSDGPAPFSISRRLAASHNDASGGAANRGCRRVGGGPHGRGSHYVCDSSSGSAFHGIDRTVSPTPSAPRSQREAPAQDSAPPSDHPATALIEVSPDIDDVRTARNKGRTKRSPRARAAFQEQVPCPSNGRRYGPCPGYIVDHITPLCLGGADAHANMQWQARAASLDKDVQERAACRVRW
jgi:hypothetical protein